MAIELISGFWDFMTGFFGSDYLAALMIFISVFAFFLLMFQGNFELSLIASLMTAFLFSEQLPWLKATVLIIIGLWIAAKVIDMFGQRNG